MQVEFRILAAVERDRLLHRSTSLLQSSKTEQHPGIGIQQRGVVAVQLHRAGCHGKGPVELTGIPGRFAYKIGVVIEHHRVIVVIM